MSTREDDKPHGTDGEPLTSAHDDAKRRATLAAQLALAGFVLDDSAAGGFSVHRWNLHRDLPTLDAVEAFARQVGA